jgi:hypothetical protein
LQTGTGEQRMNTKMNTPSHLNTGIALLLLVAAVLACGGLGDVGSETAQANKLVGEGNAAVLEGQKYVAEAEQKKQQMFGPRMNLTDARSIAKEAIAAYDMAKEKCKLASKKYEEASKLKINDKFKEYLTLKVREYDKRAELVETAKGNPQALIDARNRSTFIGMANANNERVDRLSREAKDLGAQADKLQQENPNIFKE